MYYGKFATLFFLSLFSIYHFASGADGDGYRIDVKVNNLKDSVCYLGFYYGDKKYVQDYERWTSTLQYQLEAI